MRLNQKGNIAIAAALLVTAVIGLLIIDQTATVIWVDTAVTNESIGTITNVGADSIKTLGNNCLTLAPTSVYDWTNATEIAATNYTITPGLYPNRIANVLNFTTMTTHNNTIVGVNYTYSCTYGSTATIRLIFENLAIIAGVLVLGLAGAWLYLK